MTKQNTTPKPSELELQILAILWDGGPATVHEIRRRLPDGKRRAYTTVLSLVQVMERKGLVDHAVQGPAHVYRPRVARRQVLRPLMRGLLRNVFGDRAADAVQCLLDARQIDDEELAQIRAVIQKTSRKPKGGD